MADITLQRLEGDEALRATIRDSATSFAKRLSDAQSQADIEGVATGLLRLHTLLMAWLCCVCRHRPSVKCVRGTGSREGRTVRSASVAVHALSV